MSSEKFSPTFFESGQIGPGYPPWKKLADYGLQARLRRHQSLIHLLEALAPPSKLDCCERRLRHPNDDVPHRIVDCEQGIERRTQLGRPVKPDEITVANFNGSRQP